MSFIDNLKVKIFADGSDLQGMIKLAQNDWIKGLTTNPTLMAKAGIKDYKSFALAVLSHIKNKPISFEIFTDDLDDMKRQALEIASWADNVYVKLPITNTLGISTCPLMKELSEQGVKINATALFTLEQVSEAVEAVKNGAPSVISVFAGRIADTGVAPKPLMTEALKICQAANPNIELLWASPRELYNIIEAEECGTHIITVSHDILGKIGLFGKDLKQFSLETVKMFYNDATKAGFTI